MLAVKNARTNGTGEERRTSRRRLEASPTNNQRLSNSRRSRASDDLLLDNALLLKLLEEVSKSSHSWPFLRPVSKTEVPDYHKVIRNPMDMGKVKSKLNMGKYSTNYEVLKDIQLIFENCDLYNKTNSEIYV